MADSAAVDLVDDRPSRSSSPAGSAPDGAGGGHAVDITGYTEDDDEDDDETDEGERTPVPIELSSAMVDAAFAFFELSSEKSDDEAPSVWPRELVANVVWLSMLGVPPCGLCGGQCYGRLPIAGTADDDDDGKQKSNNNESGVTVQAMPSPFVPQLTMGVCRLLEGAATRDMALLRWLTKRERCSTASVYFQIARAALASPRDRDVTDVLDFALVDNKSPEQEEGDALSLLQAAVYAGSTARLEWLWERGFTVQERKAFQLLGAALYNRDGPTDVVRWLHAHGADIRGAARFGFTPLTTAAQRGSVEHAKVLLELGADPTTGGAREDDPFLWPIFYAAGNGSVAVAALLMDAGARFDVADRSGDTPLHRACCNNEPASVELLLDRGTSVERLGINGETPLLTAAATGSMKVIQLLIARGADVNAKTAEGKTVFDLARRDETKALLQSLINPAS